jgi:pseudo-rSAM protein
MKDIDFENMRRGTDYWFFLHPFVYVSVKKDNAVLYNTLSRNLLEYRRGSIQYNLVKRLDHNSNLYVIKIKAAEIDSTTDEFITQIKNLYFGDVMDTALSSQKPIQLKPILNLQRTLESLTIEAGRTRLMENDDIPDYLNIITLYINDECSQSCAVCMDAYKQFLCCHKRNGAKKLLLKEDITLLIDQIRTCNLHKFNITGGNLFAYPGLEELVRFLNGTGMIKEYYFHYLNIENQPDFFKSVQEGNNQITVTAHFPIDRKSFAGKMEILRRHLPVSKENVHFILQNETDIRFAEELISTFQLDRTQLVPFFNGDNIDFFQKYVFLDRESILQGHPEINDILVRSVLNTSEFKKLNILSDKSIHANLNNPKIGRLGKDHVMEILYKELHKGKSWTKVRKHVKPCKSCTFHALCPPISNYEYAMGRYWRLGRVGERLSV